MTVKNLKHTIFCLILFLCMLQLVRYTLKQLYSLFFPATLLNLTALSACIFAVYSIVFLIVSRKKNFYLTVLPHPYHRRYTIFSVSLIALIILSCFWAFEDSQLAGTEVLYGCIFTPVLEELLFRGYVWRRLSDACTNPKAVLLLSALLFALWHLSYADTVLYRAGLRQEKI